MAASVKGKMNIKNAVKDKENYAGIVAWFQSRGDLDVEQLELLTDTIGEMSEEIFEHYKALCDMLKEQLQRIRRICGEEGCGKAYPDDSMRRRLACVIERACEQRVILKEKYEVLADELKK